MVLVSHMTLINESTETCVYLQSARMHSEKAWCCEHIKAVRSPVEESYELADMRELNESCKQM
jgi:hypothetical protein